MTNLNTSPSAGRLTESELDAAIAADDARADGLCEARAERARQRCQCSGDMPGVCPGPANCPMCDDGGES